MSAQDIVTFVRPWPDVDRIVVHCMAGQSRSPGVAMGLCDLFGWPLRDMEERYPLRNTRVRSELVSAGRLALQTGEPLDPVSRARRAAPAPLPQAPSD